MNYVELFIPVCDDLQAEIWMAELAEFPFDSFEQSDISLKAYIRKNDLAACRAEVDAFLMTTGVQCRFTPIKAENWNAVWESDFEPVEVGGRCLIRAPFHEPRPNCELDIVIMPKMSFGTGHHATTYLMVDQIMREDFSGMVGLDMGSGTGVLAIAAIKLGAKQIDAVDIDEWAYENCVENIAVNGVSESVTPILGSVETIEGRQYDFILANINRNILLADMSNYKSCLRHDGVLIMSGILESDLPTIVAKAESLGMSFKNSSTREGWSVVTVVCCP